MPVLETPSRIWRRIEQNEANNDELPSLPSVSDLDEPQTELSVSRGEFLPPPAPYQSTPTNTTAASYTHARQTSSQTRFANSILKASRSTRGTNIVTDDEDSFDISRISYVANEPGIGTELELEHSLNDLSFRGASLAHDPSNAKLTPNASYASKSPAQQEISRSIRSDKKTSTWATPTDESVHRSPSPASTPSLSRSSISASSASSLRSAASLNENLTPSRRPSPRQSLSPPAPPASGTPSIQEPEEEEDITTMHEPSPPSPPARDASYHLDTTPRPPATTPRAPRAAVTLATPSMRRRDFLMALVDSNARPRVAAPTPHPLRRPLATPIARTPHPLSQVVYVAGNTTAETDSADLSTASSHDLTVHRRANASFDPTTTRNAASLAKFDTQKLNTYLHALNKRLTEENRVLNERLGLTGSPSSIAYEKSRSLLERIDQSQAEDPEQLASETFINAMLEDLAAVEHDKDRVQQELEEERKLRARDNDVYKKRLADVEHGVENIVQELEDRLADADKEAKQVQRSLKSAEAERDAEKARAERAERRLASRDDGRAVEAGEMAAAQDRIAELTHELTTTKNELRRAEDDLAAAQRDVEASRAQVRALERKVRDVEDEGVGKDQDLRISKTMAMELQQQVESLTAQLEKAQDEHGIAEERIQDLEHDYIETYQEAERLRMQVETMRTANMQSEAALEEAERQMVEDAANISRLHHQVADLQHDVRDASRRGVDASAGRSTISAPVDEEDISVLRADLKAANAEIGRLKYTYGQTPVRNAITKAKDSRLEDLERRNEALEEELAELHRLVVGANSISKANISIGKPDTPLAFKQTMHRINNLVRTPKTPGAPLKDASWALSTPGRTGQDSLLANIANIQRQLNRAEADLGVVNAEDEDRWGLAQLSAAELRRRLGDAQTRIAALQAELRALRQKVEDTPQTVPECDKCASQGLSAPAVDRSFEAISGNRAANPRQRLPLRDANVNVPKPSDAELQKVKKEHVAAQARIEAELNKAKGTVSSLQTDLEAERVRLADLAAEQARAADERDNAVRQLRRTKEGMEDVKNQLSQIKQENEALEAQVQRNAERGQRLASLENKLSENQRTIEHLRSDRESLLTEHDQMHQRYKATTDRLQQLRDEHATAVATQDKRQRQLESQAREIESLKAALSKQVTKMQDAQNHHERMNADRDEQLAELAQDLKHVKQEANAFGRQLELLRQEKENLEAKRHEAAVDSRQQQSLEREIGDLKLRHNQECKGLFVQIQYLKSKFTRETLMRDNLTYQKGYLLILLGRFERRENRIVASIARIGFPHQVQDRAQEKSTPRRLLRASISAVLFTLRARKAASAWRQECASRQAIQDALEDVRRRRVGVVDT
ncbi:hypothetical protein EXIGLDRAFT_762117 [Exidia glandulosa HHB12029]|uniref:Pericentrin/AKAP-450 centrosomal targeting domain-containing protein n=1 Tax=Exidia glandulosa HHB12029 TaxID=1314781 RepID=A0A165N096_EXIGL|nr:hypothetical protein EXIGLDRAFT_762117 [Exidia glandulosa HHB12029]